MIQDRPPTITAYRIGWTTNRAWWAPHRPWQAEGEGPRFARRAFTRAGAERKTRRDQDAWPRRTPHQAWRWWRATVLNPAVCRVVGHKAYRLPTGPRPRRHPPSRWCKRCLKDLP